MSGSMQMYLLASFGVPVDVKTKKKFKHMLQTHHYKTDNFKYTLYNTRSFQVFYIFVVK